MSSPSYIKFTLFLGLLSLISCSTQLNQSDTYLLKNISVIDPIDGFIDKKNVLIKGNKIHCVRAPEKIDQIALEHIIDCSGKFLIPGLWDAHIHFAFNKKLSASMPRLFLAHGITSVRDTGGPLAAVNKAKERSTKEPKKEPTVYIAGPLIDGSPNIYNNSSSSFPLLSIRNKDTLDVISNTFSIIEKDVDFLKAYEMLTEEQFSILARLATKNNLKLTGHIPLSMNIYSAVKAGLRGMEHMRNLELSIASNAKELLHERKIMLRNPKNLEGSELRASIHKRQRMSAIDSINEEAFTKAAAFLAKKKYGKPLH